MRLYLVRHGQAGRKDRWRGPDRLRPLDGRGRRQTERLAQVIRPLGPARIVSSPYLRCLQTMEPLAEALDRQIERSKALVPAATREALALVKSLGVGRLQGGIVLCTHGEVMGAVLAELAREADLELERRPPGLKGCLWVLEMRRRMLVSAHYVGP